ncbi:MAG: DUF1593 domain-containing protein [Kiritimatiellia bacterium]|jgi:hypothetical protein|nr:DUF1593 domain-containing protein [Kiritimatiellia bacterium]
MHNYISILTSALVCLLTITVSADELAFYRGVNLGGPAITIDGRRWDGDNAKGLVCKDRVLVLKDRLELSSRTDDARKTMLHSFRWNRGGHVRFADVPAGTYTVWLYVVEDNNPEIFDIAVEEIPALRGLNSGGKGTWQKVGPLVVKIEDGTIDIKTRGGAANICGIEIWKGAPKGVRLLIAPHGGKPLNSAKTTISKAPVSPFLGKFPDHKPRVMVMTDIGGDPDDRQSLVRYLLYTCDFETEGFCTGFGWGHDRKTRPDLIHKAIDAYAKVEKNLRKHRKDYPSAASLKALVKDGSNGNKHQVGAGNDSEASDWIIKVLEKDDPRPVWFSIWGGPRELAQALWKMQQTKSLEELTRLKAKIRVHSIADQDKTAGWIKQNHPDVFYLYSKFLYRGVWQHGDQDIVSRAWLKEHVLTGHGALGAPEVYPIDAHGKKGIKEGDTPSYFWVLRNGLSDPEAPSWGNWGGRFQYSGAGSEFVPAQDIHNGKPDMYYTIWRWRTAYQNEFQARMDWCVKPYNEANHEPKAVCNGKKGIGTVHINARPGERVTLSAKGSSDPDGNTISYRWWNYRDAGTYDADVAIEGGTSEEAAINTPPDASGKTIHVILEVVDSGRPPLVAYRRVIVSVK